MTDGKRRRNGAAKGMPDDNGSRNPSLLHKKCDGVGLPIRENIAFAADIRVAVPRPVDKQQLRPAAELCEKGVHRIVKAGARPVNEEDRRKIGAFSRLEQDAVQLVAAHINSHGNDMFFFGSRGLCGGKREKRSENKGKGKREEPVRHSSIYHVLHARLTVSAAFKRA